MNKTLLVIGLAGLAMLAAACSPAAPVFEQEFEGITGVVLNTSQDARTEGTVVVNGADQAVAEVSVAASFSDPEQLDIRVEEGLLIIEHDCGGATSCTVDYELTLPEATPIEVTTNDASVTVSDLKAGVGVTTDTGSTFVRRIEGDIVVGTGTGQITGTQNQSRVASFTSQESDISVSFDAIIDTLRIETGKGDLTAQLTGGPYNLTIDQGSGSTDVKIETSESAANAVTLRTGSGDIKLFQN